jgi:hypothetical protein
VTLFHLLIPAIIEAAAISLVSIHQFLETTTDVLIDRAYETLFPRSFAGVKLLARRWYPAVHLMPEGDRMVIIGGANVGQGFITYDEKESEANYEFYPQTKPADRKLRDLPVLKRAFPCPLYPFLHLMPNGYFFVMANMDAVLYNFDTGDEIILPQMPGKITRSYPYTGERYSVKCLQLRS